MLYANFGEFDGLFVWALIMAVYFSLLYLDFLLMRFWDYLGERLSKWKKN